MIGDPEETLIDVEFLSRSSGRLQILLEIAESSCSLTDLQQRLDIHRTTLRRNLTDLEKRNWIEVEPTENSYHLSPAGTIVVESFQRLLEDMRTANRFAVFIDRLPKPAKSPLSDAKLLKSCNITVTQERNPYAPMSRLTGLIDETNTLRASLPTINPRYLETLEAKIRDEIEYELVVSSKGLETIRTNHPEVLDTLRRTEAISLFVSGSLPLLSVNILENVVAVATYDQSMRLHGLLETSDDQKRVIEWVEQHYNSQKQTAKPLAEWID